MTAAVSPIMDALYHGRADEAQRLLAEAGAATMNVHEAAAMGAVERLEQLLDHNAADVNAWSADGFQPLQLAAFFGRPEAVELLLARGAEVSTPARHQFHVTALQEAAANGALDLVRVLLDRGADPAATDDNGRTAADWARDRGQTAVLELLERAGRF